MTTLVLASLTLEGHPAPDGRIRCVVHSATGQQELTVSLAEWTSLSALEQLLMLVEEQHRKDVAEVTRMQVQRDEARAALVAAVAAAQRFVAHVDDLASFADDDDPRVMATAGPLGEAQAELWEALGLSVEDERARLEADIDSRCAVCGWTLAESVDTGCVRGNCSLRARPEKLYAPERAERELQATEQAQ